MKKILLISLLVLTPFLRSNGQWYTKQYQVSDINSLTQEQLSESLIKSRSGLLVSGCVFGTGGVIYLLFRYLRPGMSDDPSFFEELIGDEGVNNIGMAVGIMTMTAGVISSVVYLGRIGRIKSTISRNYLATYLKISPAMYVSRNSRTACPGLTLTLNF
jgi:hypothetical protein